MSILHVYDTVLDTEDNQYRDIIPLLPEQLYKYVFFVTILENKLFSYCIVDFIWPALNVCLTKQQHSI